MLRRLAGVHCVHYIEEKDCTARFATGAISEIPDKQLNQIDTRRHLPHRREGLYTDGPQQDDNVWRLTLAVLYCGEIDSAQYDTKGRLTQHSIIYCEEIQKN